ncbi:hypothetical protein [Sedimentitalea sp.]|uniref:hypothetical protein n=1 Tax=Sedimentitalea sp. TaxID=2048915 RepID=UPI00329740AB
MNTLISSGICVVVLLCVTGASAEQVNKLLGSLADNDTPHSIACAQERGVSLGQCSYSIKKDENGKSTVTVVFANGFKRSLFFKDGEFLKASVTMSGVGTNADWILNDGTHFIHVDGQRYEVPDTLIAGK